MQDILKMLIQRVQQTVTEAPEEEQHCDKANGIYRLAQSQFRRLGATGIVRLERALLKETDSAHDVDGVAAT